MLVDFALIGQRERGLGTEEAIHEAARLRFRPIRLAAKAAAEVFGPACRSANCMAST